MGLFSNDKKYLAFAGTGDLIPEEDWVDTLESAILNAMMANESTSLAVQYGLATDMGSRGKSMIKYAARYNDPTREGGYVRGLPTSDQSNFSIPDGVLLDALERDLGESVEQAPWMFIGDADEIFLLDQHIQAAYLDPAYFPWGVAPSVPVWDEKLDFIEIPVIDPSTGQYYVTDNEPVFVRTDEFSGEYAFGFEYTANTGDIETWESPGTLNLSGYVGQSLIQVRYSTIANPLQTDYWIYVVGSNADPQLESQIDINVVQNNFMPVVIMMQDKVWFNEEEDSELHITTNKLLKKLAMDGDEIRVDFEQQEADDLESGDAKKRDPEKWDFFIHFAAPVMGKARGTLEYLYYFFLEMEKNQQHTFDDYQTFLASRSDKRNGYDLPQPISEIKITEGGINGYNVRFGWSYIYSETFDGQYTGNTGIPLRSQRFDSDLYQRLPENDTTYREGLVEMHGPNILLGKARVEEKEKTHKNGYHDYVIYTQQHYDHDTDTWSHTRVLCMGLSMEYTINTKETDTGKKGYRFRYSEPHIFDINEETGEYLNGFRIPIHIGILQNQMKKVHHEELLQEAMSATVFLVKEISIPWYQTGFWKWLIVIVAIILIVLSIVYAGGAGSETLLSVIVGALGATGIWAFILYAVLVFAMGFIIGLASQTVGQEFGATAGMIFQIIGTIAMMYAQGGDLTSGFQGFETWGAAQSTITSTLTVVNTGLQVYQVHVTAKLEADLKDFMQTAREKQEELREAWDQLGEGSDGVEVFGLMAATDRGATGERPETFLARSLNANPGLLGYHYVYSFTQMAMMLPTRPGEISAIENQKLVFQKQIGAV